MSRILVIDDEDQVRNVLRRMLEKMGHEVQEACDGVSGLECFKEDPVDLVISDVFMPEKDGLETLMELRQLDPRAKILLISGNWERICVDAGHLAEHMGSLGVIQKPFMMKDVQVMVETALECSAK